MRIVSSQFGRLALAGALLPLFLYLGRGRNQHLRVSDVRDGLRNGMSVAETEAALGVKLYGRHDFGEASFQLCASTDGYLSLFTPHHNLSLIFADDKLASAGVNYVYGVDERYTTILGGDGPKRGALGWDSLVHTRSEGG